MIISCDEQVNEVYEPHKLDNNLYDHTVNSAINFLRKHNFNKIKVYEDDSLFASGEILLDKDISRFGLDSSDFNYNFWNDSVAIFSLFEHDGDPNFKKISTFKLDVKHENLYDFEFFLDYPDTNYLEPYYVFSNNSLVLEGSINSEEIFFEKAGMQKYSLKYYWQIWRRRIPYTICYETGYTLESKRDYDSIPRKWTIIISR